MPEWRNLVWGAMIVILPGSLAGQEPVRAMLHSGEQTRLNGNAAPTSSAIFPHDLIQTAQLGNAKIDAQGTAVTILPDTIVQFEGDELVLDHGRLQLNTARQARVRVNCLMVTPVVPDWTHYDVVDVDGKVTVAAYDQDVKIHLRAAGVRSARQSENSDTVVHAGQQVTRDEHCGAPAKLSDAVDANGPLLNHPIAVGIGASAILGVTFWALCRSDDPISPASPGGWCLH